MHLLITYTHHSELQVITALSLIFTIHKLQQHPLSLSSAWCIFISRSLATASNSGDFSVLRAHRLPCRTQFTTDSFFHSIPYRTHSQLTLCQLTTNWVVPIVFKVTPRHGPHRKHPFPLLQSNCCTCLAMGCTKSFPTVALLL
jgi:hypothetical protein